MTYGDRNIIGYWHFVLPTASLLSKIAGGDYRDSDIKSDSVVAIEGRGFYKAYLVSIGLLKEYRDLNRLEALRYSLIDVLKQLARDNMVWFDEFWACAYTKEGINACERNMRYVTDHRHIKGARMYKLDMLNDLRHTDLRFYNDLVQEYESGRRFRLEL